ncbi:MAG TPA: hypothetical protein VJT82_02655, partial [Pyrinomonadaceae bacterium]|nr:hypothetical protein [Pyrinomonadaceae bacterium]
MMTEELIQEQPLTFEIEYADAPQETAPVVERETEHTAHDEHDAESRTKKEQILALYEQGTTDIAQIVRTV